MIANDDDERKTHAKYDRLESDRGQVAFLCVKSILFVKLKWRKMN